MTSGGRTIPLKLAGHWVDGHLHRQGPDLFIDIPAELISAAEADHPGRGVRHGYQLMLESFRLANLLSELQIAEADPVTQLVNEIENLQWRSDWQRANAREFARRLREAVRLLSEVNLAARGVPATPANRAAAWATARQLVNLAAANARSRPSARQVNWRQPICLACWERRSQGVEPARAVTRPDETGSNEICAYCGARTSDGIYVRAHEDEVPFPSRPSEREDA